MVSKKRERKTSSVPTGPVSTWEQFVEALADAPVPRPAESITAEEFAARFGYSEPHSRKLLADKAKAGELREIAYFSAAHKRAKCYVRA